MASKRILRLVKIVSGAASEAEDDFFELEGRIERFLHFWVLVCKSFIRNRCLIRASALSYASLLALIPLLAVAISVTSSLLKKEGEEKIYQAIDQFVAKMVPPSNTNQPTIKVSSEGGNTLAVSITVPDKTSTATNLPAPATGLTNQVYIATGTNADLGTNPPVAAASGKDGSAPVVSVSAQKTAAKSIHEFVQKSQSGTLGAIGMLLLVFVAIRMLANIEATFNDIWGVTRGRSWVWRIVLYWTTITLGPLALVGVLGLAGSSHLKTVENIFQQMPFIGSLLFDFLPLVLLWLIFALVYFMVPNTKVKFSAALVGGIVAGSAWHVNNMLGFLYASRIVTYSKIYGSLGLVPVFMVGLYFTWVILLFGAQVAYAFQNRKTYLQKKLVENVNQRGREFVALRLMTSLAQRFQNGQRPATIFQLSSELGIPDQLAHSVLRVLAARQLATEIGGADPAFMPARPLETINAYDILLALRTGGGQELPVRDEPALAAIYGEFGRIEHAERTAASSISLLALANRVPVAAQLAEPKIISDHRKITEAAAAPEPEDHAPELADEKVQLPPDAEEPASTPEKPEAKPAAAPKTDPGPPGKRDVIRPEENREFPL